MAETKKPTPADVEKYLLSIHPSTPPEMVAGFMRAVPRGVWPAPSVLQGIMSRTLLRLAGAEDLVASLAGVRVREYRAERGWKPESYWDRANLREFIDQTIEEICDVSNE